VAAGCQSEWIAMEMPFTIEQGSGTRLVTFGDGPGTSFWLAAQLLSVLPSVGGARAGTMLHADRVAMG